MRIEDIKYELEYDYKELKLYEKVLRNDECFADDRNFFINCEIYYRVKFEELYNEYSKTYREYIFGGNKFLILFRVIYWFKYREIKKELKKFLFYLKVTYD